METSSSNSDNKPVPGKTVRRRRGRPAGNGTAPQVQSLHRALTLLELVSRYEQGASLSQLAELSDLAPSTAHRLLRSLEQMEYLHQDNERGLWFVGVKAFTVGNAFVRSRDIAAIARPVMWELMENVAESVNLAVLDGGDAVYLSQVECRQMMRAHALPGARAPLHCSGIGKALLSALPESQVDRLIKARRLVAQTPKTITNRKELKREISRVRQTGYAVDDEEQSLGMRCVAAVIYDENGNPAAALSVTGPSARIDTARIAELGEIVRAAADKITRAIGGKNDGDPNE